MIRKYLIIIGLSMVMGLLCGVVIGGWMNKPWWYVFPISLIGGIAMGLAVRRK